jgi:lipid II:glycine glycyltransferase (peptidoglycan interpeptide bridge formation enzyme)
MNIPFTQTKEYLGWHVAVGSKTFYFDFFRDISETEDFQIDEEKTKEKYAVAACVILNLRIGKVLYIPYGPVFLSTVTESEKQKVINKLHEIAKKENCVFVRLENSVMGEREEKIFVDRKKAAEQFASSSQAESSGRKNSFFLYRPNKKAFRNDGVFQPRMEWWLNIEESEEEILNRIHKDHKYSIRRAEKENVQVEIINSNYHEYFEDFYNLMLETGERNGFGIYDRKYYEAVFNSLEKHEMKGFLTFAKIDEKLVSIALIIFSGQIANFVFGASNNYRREVGANPYLQYKCILESKRHGCEIYNFGGITENGYGKKSLEDLTKYKKKFGGYAKFHGDFVDMPIQKIKYFLYILRKMF